MTSSGVTDASHCLLQEAIEQTRKALEEDTEVYPDNNDWNPGIYLLRPDFHLYVFLKELGHLIRSRKQAHKHYNAYLDILEYDDSISPAERWSASSPV